MDLKIIRYIHTLAVLLYNLIINKYNVLWAMKRIGHILAFGILALFASCAVSLDKEIDTTKYQEEIDKIYKSNDYYSDEDFNKADEMIFEIHIMNLAQEKNTIGITYRQLLDKAREINLEEAKEHQRYQNELDAIAKHLVVSGIRSKYVEGEDFEDILIEFTVENISEKPIVRLNGSIVVESEKGNTIGTYYYSSDKDFILSSEARQSVSKQFNIIYGVDITSMIKNEDHSIFKYKWFASEIEFEDGQVLKAEEVKSHNL